MLLYGSRGIKRDKRLSKRNGAKMKSNELKSLQRLCPCVNQKVLLRIEGRLINAHDLFANRKHPIILLMRDVITRLAVLW